MEYDVIIIGGSFSGLSSAYFLAQKGLKVCLFEGGKIGLRTKSTGILTRSVIKDLKVPDNLIETDIYGFFLYSPNMIEYEYRFNKPLFYLSDTLNFLKWLKNLAVDLDVKIIEDKVCRNVRINSNGVKCEGISGKMAIFASCFLPDNIKRLIPKEDVVYYAGLEYIANGIKTKDKNMWEVYLDYDIAPGYFSWVLPTNTNLSHVGVAKKINNISVQKSMSCFLKKTGMKLEKIKEKRAGIVPLSGPRKKTYGNRFILVGDVAGQIGASSSAGINYSVRSAKIISRMIPACIDDPIEESLRLYEKKWKEEFGDILYEEVRLRKLFDRINNNSKLEIFLQLLDSMPKRKIYEILVRFTNLKYMHVRKTFAPCLFNLERLKKTIQLFLH